MDVSFEDYKYYPALRTRPAEMYGYRQLSDESKRNMLPIITLGAWRNQEGISESISQLQKAVGERPFILDLTAESSHQNAALRKVLDSEENFKAWQSYVTDIPNAVPVIQITPSAKNQQIIRQTRQLENSGLGKVAFRITDFLSETDKVTTALSAMDSPENALVIIDVGYIRETMAASIAACVTAINQVREDVEDAIIAVISTSFPASVTSHLDANSGGKRGIIGILERVLHQEIGGSEVAIYGDHSSIHAKVYANAGGRYTPRIDYPLYDAWAFERRPETNSTGYIDAATTLIESYPEILEDGSWGAEMIRKAAEGLIDGMKTPSSWIAARVNMHISRQLALSLESPDGDEEDFDIYE
ncbi:beta family protein [Rhodocyclus tenuis]|uniref:Protein beta n=1 Tax=Rhodocyclus tenuis TaxID=1066 RepID=A0A840GDP0_RHOTE|nr:beta family protein [Rhodocyclus tenuis]MBB4246349.1 hypothetical protein [Rhodocyclus tenuis]